MRALIYLRSKEGLFDDQLHKCKTKAAQLKISEVYKYKDLARDYEDKISLYALISFIIPGDIVITSDGSRLSRKPEELEKINKMIKDRGGELIFADSVLLN
jgi:DNA invertase Pin-like site-specific DNA recombinase